MAQELQELINEPQKEKKKVHPVLWFVVGVLATLGSAFSIGHFFYQEEKLDLSPYEQQIMQLKEELSFIRDQYGHFVATNEEKKEQNNDSKALNEKLRSLEESFSQFKLATTQTPSPEGSQNELLGYLNQIAEETKKIEDNQNLMIAFITLKEIKSKINKGQLYDEEFKILRESSLNLEALLPELIQRLADPYPNLPELKANFKHAWNEMNKTSEQNISVSSMGNWIKITKTNNTKTNEHSEKSLLKDDLYRDVLFAIDTGNFSQALEIIRVLPKERAKHFDNWLQQVHQYVEGQNLQDHIDHWMKSAYKKIVLKNLQK